ncbi:hypothetical protein UO65_2654 [Actinokineospora spheciospongiae]|uniref:Uncharacterized protein n=1 Tax=Actinokineospora spheciospongiae TaxID=909613 RepID=W7IMC7_9PSEU|nr:hypothetical protein UO65_2654 [Actinokineospora spheciospongiae]
MGRGRCPGGGSVTAPGVRGRRPRTLRSGQSGSSLSAVSAAGVTSGRPLSAGQTRFRKTSVRFC